MSEASYQVRPNLTAVITRDETSVTVEIQAPLYVNKVLKVPHSYSPEFTDGEILNDYHFRRFMDTRYGKE